MKNKTKTYLLLTTVLCLWGTIGYKILNGLSPDAPQKVPQEFNRTFKPKTTAALETFSIQNSERDPFLGTFPSAKKKKVFISTKTKKKEPVKNSPIITYGGIIKTQNTGEQIFVVNIAKTQYLIKQGQTVDSVKLLKGNSKEIVVSYHHKLQTIKHQ